MRPYHLRVISRAALRGWRLWSLDIKNESSQADGFEGHVSFQSPPERVTGDSRRVWKLNAPANGFNGATVAFRRILKRFLVASKGSPKFVDLQLGASKFDPCLSFVYRRSGPSGGVITTHIDDLLGCGWKDLLEKMERVSASRFGSVKVQRDYFAHIGMDILQMADGPAGPTQLEFTNSLRPIATSPSQWREGTRPLNGEGLQICQSKLGELCRLATMSRPDILPAWRASLPISKIFGSSDRNGGTLAEKMHPEISSYPHVARQALTPPFG